MGDIVNLRRVRKVRKRDAAAAQATLQRAAHGRTKAQKQWDAAAVARGDALLNGAKREP